MASGVFMAVCIVGSLIAYLAAIGITTYCNIPSISPFNSSIGELSDKYYVGITPSDGTFAIWSVIYPWLLVVAIYSQTLLCRKVGSKRLDVDPGFISPVFCIFYSISFLASAAWIYVFLSEEIWGSFIALFISTAAAYVALYSSCWRLAQCESQMVVKNLIADIWCTHAIIQNGLALYAAWISCATVLNAIMVAVYVYGVSMEMCCFVGLAFLNALTLGWFVVENFIWPVPTMYVFGHYGAFIAALVGSYLRNYDPQVTYTIYGLALLGLVCVLALLKVTIFIARLVAGRSVGTRSELEPLTEK